jgi:chemotaxis protein MotA
MGILGAVMGLVHVMQNLTDPSKIGIGIAVAFVATIYGVGMANLVFLPIYHKLRNVVSHRVRHREMIRDGMVSMARGDNPRLTEQRLKYYF